MTVTKRIAVDWELGGYLDVSAWCTRSPAPGKPFNYDVWFVNSFALPTAIDVPAGTQGQLDFFIKIAYEIKPDTKWLIKYLFFRETGSQTYRLTWDCKCTPDGQLTLSRNRSGHQTWSGPVNMKIGATDLTPAASSGSLPYVELFAEFSYAEGDDGEVAFMGEHGFITLPRHAPRGMGAEVGLRLSFNVTGKREEVVLFVDKTLYFEHEGQPDLDQNVAPGNRIQDLQDWVEALRSHTEEFDALSKRYFPIHLRGFASKTDNEAKNFDLSDTRLQNVQRRLDRLLGKKFGKDIWFDAIPRGKREAKGSDNVPAAQRDRAYLNDRRVEIRIDPGEAFKGIKDMREGKPPPSA
jgi:hypothetical protein